MLDEMCATLGGRAAEELFTGHISSGALNDLERVTKQAYSMIAYLGMSERLPNLCYYNNDEYNFTKPYSDQTAQLIDEEVKHMIAEQYERAKSLLREHTEELLSMNEELPGDEMAQESDEQKEEQAVPNPDEQPTETSAEHPTEATAQASDHEAEKPQDTQAPKEK